MQRYVLTTEHTGGATMCSSFPELPSIVNVNSGRIISIGDIHGDLDLAIESLEVPKLIERVYEPDDMTVELWYKEERVKRLYKWIGTDTIVVQVGDQVDRCRPFNDECHVPSATIDDEASDVTIMFFYHDLHIVAQKVNCAVYSLLGNHELLNVLGNMRYVSYKGLKEFPTNSTDIAQGRIAAFSVDSKKKLFKNKSTLAEFLACSRLTSIIVNGYLFVHAGIMERLIHYTNKKKKVANRESVPTINNLIRDWLLDKSPDKEKAFIMKLLAGKFMSPFWPRIFGTLKRDLELESDECKKYVKPVLELLNLKGIVVGHTPQMKYNINSTCSNTVWRVDIAGSKAFDEVLFDGIKDEEERQAIQKGRVTQVLEITIDKKGNDTFRLLPEELNK